MPAGPGHLVRSLIAGLAAHIVAGHQLLYCGHAHSEGLVGQDIGGGPVVGADAQLSSFSSLMPPQAAFMALGVPFSS